MTLRYVAGNIAVLAAGIAGVSALTCLMIWAVRPKKSANGSRADI
jgi:hypothetical protein